jgi:hypothetical protein
MGDATPRPWGVRGEPGKTLCITDGDSRYVVDRFGPPGSRPPGEHAANAALIVRAVNSHDAMVELAREVAKEYEDAADWKDAYGRLNRMATAALALAQTP